MLTCRLGANANRSASHRIAVAFASATLALSCPAGAFEPDDVFDVVYRFPDTGSALAQNLGLTVGAGLELDCTQVQPPGSLCFNVNFGGVFLAFIDVDADIGCLVQQASRR
ncbi:MAG: hypothetical protein AAGD86_01560, partial [Pseudomonadota bacterium]